jgi:hypothetical protein
MFELEKFLKELETERKDLERLTSAIRALPDLENIYAPQSYMHRAAILVMPYDLESFARNRDMLLAAGWEWDGDMMVQPHCGDIMPEFWKDGVRLHFHIDPTRPGSTCKKRVVSYEKVPVYEVVCNSLEE